MEDVIATLELVVSAWLMVSLGTFPAQPGTTPWLWPPHLSLKRTLKLYMKWSRKARRNRNTPGNNNAMGGRPVPTKDVDFNLEFPDYFTLCSISRLVGFKVEWTYNLLDHLRIRKLRQDGFSTHIYTMKLED